MTDGRSSTSAQEDRPDKPSWCEEYDNNPTIHYHALGLPGCRNKAEVWSSERLRWLCNTHEWLRQVRKGLQLSTELQRTPEAIVADEMRRRALEDVAEAAQAARVTQSPLSSRPRITFKEGHFDPGALPSLAEAIDRLNDLLPQDRPKVKP